MSCRALRVSAACLVLAVTFATACGDDTSRPAGAVEGNAPPGGGAAGSGGGGGGEDGGLDAGGGDADVVCNELTLGGPILDRIAVSGDPPVLGGGVILEGDYELTDVVVYVGLGGVPGATGMTVQSTLRVVEGQIATAIRYGGNAAPSEQRSLASYTLSGASLSLVDVCPAASVATVYQYGATDFTLTMTNPVTKEAFTFTRR